MCQNNDACKTGYKTRKHRNDMTHAKPLRPQSNVDRLRTHAVYSMSYTHAAYVLLGNIEVGRGVAGMSGFHSRGLAMSTLFPLRFGLGPVLENETRKAFPALREAGHTPCHWHRLPPTADLEALTLRLVEDLHAASAPRPCAASKVASKRCKTSARKRSQQRWSNATRFSPDFVTL